MSHSKAEMRRLLGSVRASLEEFERVYPFVEEAAYLPNGGSGGRSPVGESDPVGSIATNDDQRLAAEALQHAFEGLKCADYAIAIADRALRPYAKRPPTLAPHLARLPLVQQGIAAQRARQQRGEQ